MYAYPSQLAYFYTGHVDTNYKQKAYLIVSTTGNYGTAFRRVLEKFTQLTVVFPVVRNTPNMATWMFLDYAKQIDRYGVI